MSATEKTGTYTWAEQEAAIGNAKSLSSLLTTLTLSQNQIDALNSSNAPSDENEFATISDVPVVGNSAALDVGTISGTVAAGDDSRFPSIDQKSALAGTSGTPSVSNAYATNEDQRLVNGATASVYIDVNRTDTYAAIGSPDRPFKTLSGGIAYWTTLAKGCAFYLTYGTYSAGSGVSLPAYPLTIDGNGSTITYTGTFTINSTFVRRNLITSGGTTLVASGTTIFYGGSVGALTVSGKCYLYGATITGNLTIQSGGIVYKDFSTVVSGNTINNGTLYTQITVGGSFTASRAVITDATGALISSSVTSTEIGYLSGATSAIQNQINNKQPLDSDLSAIAALSGSGYSYRASDGTWSLQSGSSTISWGSITGTLSDQIDLQNEFNAKQPLNARLTTISSLTPIAGVNAFLVETPEGQITLDSSVYLTTNETITLSGDATGSGTTSIEVTLANSGVSAGSYGSDTAVPSITIDAKGRVTTATVTSIQIAESQVTNLSTDLAAKADLVDGKVPSTQLPAFVDAVIEVADYTSLPTTGETGKIYVTLDTNVTYRWSGTAYVEISASLALGETSSTAYRGDRGKTAYDHSQITTGNPHGTTKTDLSLGNVDNTSDANKPISTATATALSAKANTADLGTAAFTASTAYATAAQGATADAAASGLSSHVGNTANPHETTAAQTGAVPTSRTVNGHALTADITVTKSDVGLGNVENLAISAQTFSEVAGTNPYSSTDPIIPRYIGDRAYNNTSLEWWDGISTEESISSWQLAASSGGSASWGAITGTLSNQADLYNELNAKQTADADLTAIAGLTGTAGILIKTAANTWTLDTSTYLTTSVASSTYQPLDADLTAIAGLTGTTGILTKTAADTWSLDTNVYLTGNETITLSGDATGSGATSITVTFANTGVSAGSYGSATEVPAITVDAKGRVTAVTATSIQIAESQVTGLATDLAAKADLVEGKVPSSQLPSFVDDVIEVADYASLPTTGETGKIYVTLDTNLTYRWSGTAYVEISQSLALGETSSTAYRGDRGKIAYDFSQATTGVTSGSYGSASSVATFTVDAQGRQTAAASVSIQIAQSQVTDLGTALSAKAPLDNPTFTTGITTPAANITGLTALRALVSDASKNVTSSSVTSTELEYLSGVTSDIQTQIASKSPAITPINSQTGTTYTLVASDAGKIVTCANSAAITVTVPASTFSGGQSIILSQAGAGQITLSAGSGMTLHTTTTLKSKTQYSRIAVMFDSASEGTVIGERAAS